MHDPAQRHLWFLRLGCRMRRGRWAHCSRQHLELQQSLEQLSSSSPSLVSLPSSTSQGTPSELDQQGSQDCPHLTLHPGLFLQKDPRPTYPPPPGLFGCTCLDIKLYLICHRDGMHSACEPL